MASLTQAFGWRELFVILDLKVPETDGDDFACLVGCDRAWLVASTREGLAFVADPSVDIGVGISRPGASLTRGVGDGHVGMSGGWKEGEEQGRSGCGQRSAEEGGGFHDA